jgi:hypothetical protein
MSTTEAIDQPAPSSARARSMRIRLRGYLVRRGRQLLRLMLVLVLGLLFMAGALEAWRGASLIGLPDVGDPFDVAAFRAFRIPEEPDAIVLYHQAQAKLSPMPSLPIAIRRLGPGLWSKTVPELRDWATANRRALELFRDASERPDGIVHPSFDRDARHYYLNQLGTFAWLALLEGSRLQEQGEMDEAWNWYRTVFRMKVHAMRRGSILQRYIADSSCKWLHMRVASWAADPRTGVPLLRLALDDVKAGEPRSEWDAFSLKVDYLEMMTELDKKWGAVQQGEEEDQHVLIFGEPLPPVLAWIPYAARRYFSNEPERSRRVLRLAFANWLAHVEEKDPRHLKPAIRATFRRGNRTITVHFFAVSPDGPAAARRLTPQDLATWLIGTLDAKELLSFWPWPSIRMSERRQHRALVVLLAGELYQRERGTAPPSDEALVGPFLEHLPGDGSEELDDGSAPTITGDKATATAKPG